MLEKIIAKLKELGLIPAEKEGDIVAALKTIPPDSQTPQKIDPSKISDSDMKAVVEGLNNRLAAFEALNKELAEALTAEKKAREESVKTQEETNKKKKAEEAVKLIDLAIAAGKIKPDEKEKYVAKAVADYETMKEAIDKFAVDPHFKSTEKTEKKDDDYKFRGPLSGAPVAKLDAMQKMDATK